MSRALMEGLEQLQNVLSKTPLWADVTRYLPLATDLIHFVNLMMHELFGEQRVFFFLNFFFF